MPVTYTAIPNSDTDPDSPLTTGLITKLRDNPIAMAEGSAGAPKIETAAYTAGSVDQAAIGAAAVGQGELITASGAVSTSNTVNPSLLTLPGGQYGFYPRTKESGDGGSANISADFPQQGNTYGSFIHLKANTSGTMYAQQLYIQASPPYNLGDGDIALFIFVEVDINGNVVSAYEAPEAPWHYNGPTDIRALRYRKGKSYKDMKDVAEIDASMVAAGHPSGLTLRSARALSMQAYQDYLVAFESAKNSEMEITQAYKNSDMALIPRPMEPGAGNNVVMLDPISRLTLRLFEMKKHEEFDLLKLLHDGDLVVSNTVLNRSGPPGVDIVAYSFR